MPPYRITVGGETCDIRGFTHTQIQCAVDRCAFLGGGEVELGEGTFAMGDSLHLRTGVNVRGQGEATVLRKGAEKAARITAGLGFGHDDLVVENPDLFAAGEGIWLYDDAAPGFYSTVGTLVRREGGVWFTSRPHRHDYSHTRNAWARTLFPVVSAYDVNDATLAHLAIDGNAEENPTMINGCRGGGIFAMRSHRLHLHHLAVRQCNTEGISFQTCDDMHIEHCLAEENAGNGFHPGSGSNRFRIHDCISRKNGQCGLFYCLRVRDSILEDCVLEENALHGLSTGGRDADNQNRRLRIRHNGHGGIFFRETVRNDAPHRNLFECCEVEENGQTCASAEILIQGEVDGTRLYRNRIRRNGPEPAIRIGPETGSLAMEENEIVPPAPDAIRDERTGKDP